MPQHLAGRPARALLGTTCCALSAPCGRAQRATLGAGDAQGPWPPLLLLPPRAGCGQDRRRGPAARGPSHAAILTCAASPPKPRPVLPQSKGNFLVSRQRNNAREREGALRSQRLRLPRGPEASQAATPPAPSTATLPQLRVPSRAAGSCFLLLLHSHFFLLSGPQPVVKPLNSA